MFLNLCALLLTIALVVVCLLLILLVVMQRPRREGLSPAFGDSITDNIWGPQTGTVLHRTTVWLGVLLFALSLSLALVKSAQIRAADGLPLHGESATQSSRLFR